jgi:ATP-dependent DNA helicase PIF1
MVSVFLRRIAKKVLGAGSRDTAPGQPTSRSAHNASDFAPEGPRATRRQPSDSGSSEPQIELTVEQQEAIRIATGSDPIVFITGRAGTGKSTIIRRLRSLENVAVCAPTGIAALNCGGATLHSTFKIPPRFLDPRHPDVRTVPGLDRLSTLVIDEGSMVRADVFDHVNATLQYNRNSAAPFGGVRVIIVGDCRQLPPVVTEQERKAVRVRYRSPWWFDSQCLAGVPLRVVQLEKVHRQHDQELIGLLERVRNGTVDQETVARLNDRCYLGPVARDGLLILTARRNDADNLNRLKLDALAGTSKTYMAVATGSFSEERDINVPAPRKLELKIGTRALVTKNHGAVVNGTLGTVAGLLENSVRFRPDGAGEDILLSEASWDQYRYCLRDGHFFPDVAGTYRQIPLTYGWAVTIHKAQGLTLASVCVDLGTGAFASGQTYVALSRTRSIGGLTVRRRLNQRDFIADARVGEFHEQNGLR